MSDLPFSEYTKAGDLVFVSGQIHIDDSANLVGDTVADKTNKVLDNVEKVLKDAGLGLSDLVFVQIFVTDVKLYAELNKVYMARLPKPYPARALVEVSKLPLGADIEIVATASRK